MKIFRIDRFDGSLSDIMDPRRIGPGDLQEATNINTDTGSLASMLEQAEVSMSGFSPVLRGCGIPSPTPNLPSGSSRPFKFWFNTNGNYRHQWANWYWEIQASTSYQRIGGVLGSSSNYQYTNSSDRREEQMAQVWYNEEHMEVAPGYSSFPGTRLHNRVTNGGSSAAKVELAGATTLVNGGTLIRSAGNINKSVTYKYCYIYKVLNGLRVLGKLSAGLTVTLVNECVTVTPVATTMTSVSHVSVVGAILYRLNDETLKYHRVGAIDATASGFPGWGSASFKYDLDPSQAYSDGSALDPTRVSEEDSPYEYAVQLPPWDLIGMTTYRQMAVGWKRDPSTTTAGSTLFFSYPGLIQCWLGKQDVNGDIFQCIEMFDALWVFTSVGVYQVSGSTTDGNIIATPIPAPIPVRNTAAYCQSQGGITYLSREGFVFIQGDGQVNNISRRTVKVIGTGYMYLIDNAVGSENNYAMNAAYFQGKYYCSRANDDNTDGICYVADMRDGLQRVRWSKLKIQDGNGATSSGIAGWVVYPGNDAQLSGLYALVQSSGNTVLAKIEGSTGRRRKTVRTRDFTANPAMPFILRSILCTYSNASGDTITITVAINGTDQSDQYVFTLSDVGDYLQLDTWLPEDKIADRISLKVEGKGAIHYLEIGYDEVSFGRYPAKQ